MVKKKPKQWADDITEVCYMSKSLSTMEVVNELLELGSVRMHGPEHHYLVSAVLITIFCNSVNREALKEELLEKALSRANLIQPGSCGYFGVCGAIMAVGSAISMIEEVTPVSEDRLKALSQITLACQVRLADYSGPRCCKRSTYVVLDEIHQWFEEKYQKGKSTTTSSVPKIVCGFSNANNTCLKTACKYYN